MCRLTFAVLLSIVAVSPPLAAQGEARVQFNRDIRPLLSDNCYACHGPDAAQRKAGLRLDTEQGLLAAKEGDDPLIVPGAADRSELIARLRAEDPDDRMPPPESHKSLTAAEVDRIATWIDQGAAWQGHWAYRPLERPAVPDVGGSRWPVNPIDHFILARLRREGLAPAPEADRVTLLRRLTLDLLGLPPSPGDVDRYASSASRTAWDEEVTHLLSSPHHGERMAVFWLDLVRFADTRGVHSDNARNVAPYRDWVIRAFHENMRFDRFTVEQLAGDLLDEPTIDQRVASCYNKLNLTTEEGGSQPREFEIRAYADRVRNVSAVWLGSTMECAECHDHKFDPFTNEDFYRLSAVFADIQEKAILDKSPGIPVTDDGQTRRLAAYDERIAALRRTLATPTPALATARIAWERRVVNQARPELGPWYSVGPFAAPNAKAAFRIAFGPESGGDLATTWNDGELAWTEQPAFVDGKVHTWNGPNTARYLRREIRVDSARKVTLSLGSDDGLHVWLNGDLLLARDVSRGAKADQEKLDVSLRAGVNVLLLKINNGGGPGGFYFRLADAEFYEQILPLVRLDETSRTAPQKERLASYHRSIAPQLDATRAELARVTDERDRFVRGLPRCLVTTSGPPREVHQRPRGNWMDDSGPVVSPGTPRFLGNGAISKDGATTRLDLAHWLVSRDNPLTARAFVNRLWRLFFGVALSGNVDDLGAQGEWPTHPELLDWLAVEFIESGWDVRHMVRLMVTSRTWRQVSTDTPALRERDPENRLFARQSRFRLDAEFVRDGALAVSGLLVPDVGGASVKPYQPAGHWRHLNFPKRTWRPDAGERIWRRGLYTWWQRTFMHPALKAFDAPNRMRCIAQRNRSNVPQQALILLNDPTFVEAARVFAARLLEDAGIPTADRLRRAWRETLSRRPSLDEIDLLLDLLEKHRREYAADPAAARALLTVGRAPYAGAVDPAELAAWTSVTRTLFCLRETITRY